MSQHITDHERDTKASSRLRAYLALERAGMKHPSVLALHQRAAHTAEAGKRTAQFVRIDRGHEA